MIHIEIVYSAEHLITSNSVERGHLKGRVGGRSKTYQNLSITVHSSSFGNMRRQKTNNFVIHKFYLYIDKFDCLKLCNSGDTYTILLVLVTCLCIEQIFMLSIDFHLYI